MNTTSAERPTSSAGPDRPGFSADASADASPSDALRAALAHLGELKEYAAYFVSAKLDGLKVTARNLAIYAVLGIVGAVAVATAIVVSVVLLLVGAAHALGALLWNTYWLGDLIVGVLLLAAVGAGVVVGMKSLTKSFKKSMVDKYESRQYEQRHVYGHDVKQRAVAERFAATR